jgi:hypothetical protein
VRACVRGGVGGDGLTGPGDEGRERERDNDDDGEVEGEGMIKDRARVAICRGSVDLSRLRSREKI